MPESNEATTKTEIVHHDDDAVPDLNNDDDLQQLIEYCSRYVFAPICRGVTSKRATISPLHGNKQAILDLVNKHIKEETNQKKSEW